MVIVIFLHKVIQFFFDQKNNGYDNANNNDANNINRLEVKFSAPSH